jgi:hypothetical protein
MYYLVTIEILIDIMDKRFEIFKTFFIIAILCLYFL